MSWVTGQSAICPLGEDPDDILSAMLEGRSAVSHWSGYDPAPIYSKIGADLASVDITAKLRAEMERLPDDMAARLRPMIMRLPRHVHFSLWLAIQAWRDRNGRSDRSYAPEAVSVIVAGHNLNSHYIHQSFETYCDEPDFLDGLYAATSLDSIHASAVSELLNARGPCYTVGSACASGLQAIRAALLELQDPMVEQVYVVGGVFEAAAVELDGMAMMQAIAPDGPDGRAEAASRPFDADRFGFVPAQGGACLVLERSPESEEVLGRMEAVAVASDGQHLPVTNQQGQERVMRQALGAAGIGMQDLAFVSAHATSTPQGDTTELNAIRALCEAGAAPAVSVNAPKSMLGHALWSSALLETVLALGQLRLGRMHGTINLERPDPDWALDYCPRAPQALNGAFALKNAFGFGGYNAALVMRAGGAA